MNTVLWSLSQPELSPPAINDVQWAFVSGTVSWTHGIGGPIGLMGTSTGVRHSIHPPTRAYKKRKTGEYFDQGYQQIHSRIELSQADSQLAWH